MHYILRNKKRLHIMKVHALINIYEFQAFTPTMTAFLKRTESEPRQIWLTFPDDNAFKKEDIYAAIENTGTCEDPNDRRYKVKKKK